MSTIIGRTFIGNERMNAFRHIIHKSQWKIFYFKVFPLVSLVHNFLGNVY